MTTDTCCVSVLVPAYNSARTLARAVRSALAQDCADFELLIINDASRDGTAQVARELSAADPRVRLVNLPRNRGKPCAMNVGIGEARGQWIAVLDADDWYAPARLSSLVRIANQRQVQLIADNQFLYDDGADQVVRSAFPVESGERPLDRAAFVAGSDPYSDFDLGMLKPLVRTDFIRATGLRYRENARLSEDFLYLLDFVAAGGRGWLVGEPMYYWTQAFGSISRRWTETGAGRWRYNFLAAAQANAEALRGMERAGEQELAAVLRTRARAFRRLHWMQEVNRMRAEGATATRLMRGLLGHPSIWPLIARRGMRRAAKHLSPHSPARA